MHAAEDTPPPADEPAPLSPLQRRERAVADALRTLVRDLVRGAFESGPPDEFQFQVQARVRPEDNWSLQFEPPLRDQLMEQAQDRLAARAAYQPGRVYCFRCRSAVCEHAAPGSSRQVFGGYGSTGAPRWIEFAQALVDARDERVDQLYAEPPRLLARGDTGRDLKAGQLDSFGRQSKTYAILGQVTVGYFRLDARPVGGAPETRQAVTLQAVEGRGPDGSVVLRLNTLCSIPGGATLEELFATGEYDWLQRARDRAVAALARTEGRVNVARAARDNKLLRREMGGVPEILRGLAASLERGHRQAQRRTRHVEQRRREQRPIHMAVPDALGAPADRMLFDEKTEAVVVGGERDRFHVFTREGRHITSFVGAPGALEFRMRTHRWRVLDDEERRRFVEQFRAAAGPRT
jgi:hypothetical protein